MKINKQIKHISTPSSADIIKKTGVRAPRLIEKKFETKTKIALWGDLHLGARGCDVALVKEHIDYFAENNIYIIGMGDMLEASTKTSVGAGVYDQIYSTEVQKQYFLELIEPLDKKKLILGMHSGNHEHRIYKSAGDDVMSSMCMILGCYYLNDIQCFSIKVGNQTYSITTTHGSGSSKKFSTKIRRVRQLAERHLSDIVGYAHTHDIAIRPILRFDERDEEIRTFLCLTGGYLLYRNEYPEVQEYDPLVRGCVIFEFDDKEPNIKYEELIH